MLINDSPLLDWAHHTPKHSPTVFLGRAASILADFSTVFDFASNSARNPIFGSGLGRLVPLILGFVPVILLVGLLAIGYVRWQRSKEEM